MSTASNFSQALNAAKVELQKITADLNAKKAALEAETTKKQQTEESFRSQEIAIKQKEADLQKMKMDLTRSRNVMPAIERNIRTFTEEIRSLELKQRQATEEFSQAQRQLEAEMRAGTKK